VVKGEKASLPHPECKIVVGDVCTLDQETSLLSNPDLQGRGRGETELGGGEYIGASGGKIMCMKTRPGGGIRKKSVYLIPSQRGEGGGKRDRERKGGGP